MTIARRRWCGWCMLLGVSLFLWGSSAFAQANGSPGPDYADWFKIVTGLLIALVGAYAKGVESRVTKVEARVESSNTRITDLRELLAGQHYDKDEIDRRFDRLERLIVDARGESSKGIAAIHSRLDYMRVPSGFARQHQDDGA